MIWNLVLKYWRPVVGFLTMAAFLGWFSWQGDQNRRLKKELAAAQTSVASYEESLAVLQADSKAKIEALEIEKNQSIARAKNLEHLLGNIEGTSHEKDGPCAPVLCGTIDRLYRKSTDAD